MTDPESPEDSEWTVVLLNDDTTPMDFVVAVLQQIFDMDRESAMTLMLRIHHEGRGECGTYSHEMAKAKAAHAAAFARKYRHLPQCVIERKP